MPYSIGIDYTAAIHQTGGIGRYTREMVKAIAALSTENKLRYRLFVADGGRNFTLTPPSADFVWCPTRLTERWLARLWYRLHLPLWVECWTGPLDLFHAPDFVLRPVRPGTPTIVTIHDLSFVHEPDIVMPGMKAHLNRWVPYSAKKADHVIAVSEATRRDLIEFYHIPSEKISVLYHGVAPEFKPVNEPDRLAAVRQKYRIDDRPFILSLGTIHPRKNFKRLVKAFAQLDPSLSLVIAGDKGWNYEDIFSEVSRPGLRERVRLPGFVPDTDLPALYSAASLFVYPSLYEGFGLPVLEAMACGTPVVVSNQSALPEVAGNAGLLVDPRSVEALAAAMSKVLADTSLQRQLSLAGQARAKNFTWDNMATKLLELYKQMIAR